MIDNLPINTYLGRHKTEQIKMKTHYTVFTKLIIALLLCCILNRDKNIATAQVVLPGRCPIIPPMKNFDPNLVRNFIK